MNNKYINTNIIFSVFIGLFIFFHAVVPHDHHYNESVIISEHTETASSTDKEKNTHCFAVNILFLQKTELSVDNKIFETKFPFLFFNKKEYENKSYNFTNRKELFFCYSFKLPNFIFSQIDPARGSPSLFY